MMQAFGSEPNPVRDEFKTRLYDIFERELAARHIVLGGGVGQFDTERRRIDTVIIHHTSQPPGLSARRLSAIELVRLYAPYFANQTVENDRQSKGHPISSGHVRNGTQVFWPYHWIVRNNGQTERLLRDEEIGWHAGNWEMNCRSVAVVLDNDYEHSWPGPKELNAIAKIIATRYRNIPSERVLGHREINPKTSCPSEQFLDANGKGWKAELLSRLL